jgi:hypothetical protein
MANNNSLTFDNLCKATVIRYCPWCVVFFGWSVSWGHEFQQVPLSTVMLFYVFLSIILKNLQDIMSNVTMHVQVASFIIVI